MPQRQLPIALPPVHHETLGSYLGRLADANRLKPSLLPGILGDPRPMQRDTDFIRPWQPGAIDDLATLTGRTPAALRRALPALRMPPAAAKNAAPRIRPACRACMAARNIRGLVIQHAANHECVCLHHRRWLAAPDQHRLDTLPEVLRANIRHRRLTRRADTLIDGHRAHLDAQHRVRAWFADATHTNLNERWAHRLHLLGEDPFGNPHYPSQERVDLAAYPEAVILSCLYASHHWHDHDDIANETARRLGQIAPPTS